MSVLRNPIVQAAGQLQQLQSSDIANIGYPVHGYKNRIINGDFRVWQRGTSFTPSTAQYTADQFLAHADGSGGATVSQQSFTLGSELVGWNAPNFLRFNNVGGQSGQTESVLKGVMESVRTLAGKTVTVSFWAKADVPRNITLSLRQSFGTGGSPSSEVTIATGTVSLTTSWVRYTATYSVPSVTGKTLGSNANDYLYVRFDFQLNTLIEFDLFGLQCEEGPVATDFEHRPLVVEQLLCERYCRIVTTALNGIFNNTTNFVGGYTLRTPMRAIPTPTISTSAPTFRISGVGTVITGTGVTVSIATNADNLGGVLVLTATSFGAPSTGLLAFMQFGSVTLDASL